MPVIMNSRARRTDKHFPRYSFVLVKLNGAWMIAHQHSSFLPKPIGG